MNEPGYHLMIRDIRPDERPRERLMNYGAASLSTTELLAIIINVGIVGESVTSLSHRLLAEQGGLAGLLKLDVTELAQVRGIGPAKATKIKAALEIGRRLAATVTDERPKIESPEDVIRIVGVEMSALDQEQLRVLLLDTKHGVLATRTVYQGSANQAIVRVGELFRDAIRHAAVAIVLVHNHPSGDPTPSAADISMTADVVEAGKLLDITIIDHIIIGHGRHTSLKRLGLGFLSERR